MNGISYCGWSVGMLLAAFVMLYCFIWWLSRRLDEILKEAKKK